MIRSYQTLQSRRNSDIQFLAVLRNAGYSELCDLRLRYLHKKAPRWKQIAIDRALRRLTKPCST